MLSIFHFTLQPFDVDCLSNGLKAPLLTEDSRTGNAPLQPSIEMVKSDARKLVTGVQDAFPECKIRVAFVGYRDYDEETDVIDFTPDFATDVSSFVTKLASVRASGGGDVPEDVFTGLETAASLNWSAQGGIGSDACHNLQAKRTTSKQTLSLRACCPDHPLGLDAI
jgi:hypothetical protein